MRRKHQILKTFNKLNISQVGQTVNKGVIGTQTLINKSKGICVSTQTLTQIPFDVS